MPFPKSATGPPPPIGWYWSEKFDGYRAQWMYDDQEFYSRASKLFYRQTGLRMRCHLKSGLTVILGRKDKKLLEDGCSKRKEPEDLKIGSQLSLWLTTFRVLISLSLRGLRF